jgi:uncharacterized repeat protein (TIGR04076 family)
MRVGDRIVLDEGYRLHLKETDNVCMYSLSSVMPYYVALYREVDARALGLSRDGKNTYVQCLAPSDYIGGSTVIFKIERNNPAVS